MWNIWIDTGGTFTDCIAISPDQERQRIKILSSSVLRGTVKSVKGNQLEGHFSWPVESDIFSDFTFEVLQSDFEARVQKIDLKNKIITLDRSIPKNIQDLEFQHTSHEEVPILAARILTSTPLDKNLPPLIMRLGSTKGTNALLEKKGADVAFITTKGFEDLLVIRDQQRPHLFSLDIQTPGPIYKSAVGIYERISSEGDIQIPLDTDNLPSEILTLPRTTSIAISFLNSYKNGIHERELKQQLEKHGFTAISCSSELSANIKLLERADTTVANAYLKPIISTYINGIKSKIKEGKLWVMTSSGSIVDADNFHPKDSLLSGPAGGIVGAVTAARKSGFDKIITFDMGGTSTDVAIYNAKFDYQFETKVGDATIQSPCLHIETIAAGGGSICDFKNGLLTVGPESAGADPGPACYGGGGPLTITDINLLAGRLIPEEFGIPINPAYAEKALNRLIEKIYQRSERRYAKLEIINAFTQIANEKMADAIRKISLAKGYDPQEYCLVSFGGAGGQHAIGIAEALDIEKIAIPYEAGLLSAYGIGVAYIEVFEEKLLLHPWPLETDQDLWNDLRQKAFVRLRASGFNNSELRIKSRLYYLRFSGQENKIEIDASVPDVIEAFKTEYTNLYGHWLDNLAIEVQSIKLIASANFSMPEEDMDQVEASDGVPSGTQMTLIDGSIQTVPTFKWENLSTGAVIQSASVVSSNNTTVFISHDWSFQLDAYDTAILQRKSNNDSLKEASRIGSLELFTNRYLSVVNDMGAVLQRTSFSVNVKERMDFSCALMDAEGYLVANAPHIPVHLGSMGICVRRVLSALPINQGDVVITNHPGYGGSHLPDVTLIAPLYFKDTLVGYVANRAHHAEIGGKTPGSMPTDATRLEEEGVIIEPQYLVHGGKPQWSKIKELFLNAPYPTRAIDENLADLRGAVASLQNGISSVRQLCSLHGVEAVTQHFERLKMHVADCLKERISSFSGEYSATEYLDDGSKLNASIVINNQVVFDFSGSSSVHSNNLNATEAIVNSVVLYTLRLLIQEDLPLNEGLLQGVEIINPTGLLNPSFDKNQMPAVVGGNTEVSQRLTDTLLKALGLAACSQGTMNNLLFGNDHFGYYETICGGTGAGNGFDGHDAIHQHMTNTKITDPEIIEHRYPVQLNEFSVRENSGGKGKYNGGNGIIRSFTFLERLDLTVLTQHRKETPYGLAGGGNGDIGEQYLESEGTISELSGIENIEVKKGDTLILKTPGGGGWGKVE